MVPRYSSETWKGFVAVEGLDGAGTSTQSELLRRHLSESGRDVVLGAEPTDGSVGRRIREIMREFRNAPDRERRQVDRHLAYLFAADRHEHLHFAADSIRSHLDRGAIVITTRYLFSSYAYNARTPEDFALIDRLNAEFPLPQAVVHLRAPVEVSLARLESRAVKELYEREEELRRVDAAYQRILAPIRSRVVEGDSRKPKAALGRELADAVAKLLDAG